MPGCRTSSLANGNKRVTLQTAIIRTVRCISTASTALGSWNPSSHHLLLVERPNRPRRVRTMWAAITNLICVCQGSSFLRELTFLFGVTANAPQINFGTQVLYTLDIVPSSHHVASDNSTRLLRIDYPQSSCNA